jgi:plastocyanin
MRRVLTTLLLLTAATVGLAACGGSSGDEKATATATSAVAAAAAGETLTLEAADFSFSPVTLKLAPGAATVEVANAGNVEHNLTIAELGVDQDLEAGKTATVEVDAKAGTYSYFCKYHPAKMKGTLTVG